MAGVRVLQQEGVPRRPHERDLQEAYAVRSHMYEQEASVFYEDRWSWERPASVTIVISVWLVAGCWRALRTGGRQLGNPSLFRYAT